jgi:hypothetical protein
LTGIADRKTGTISFWLKPKAADGTVMRLLDSTPSSGGNGLLVDRLTSNTMDHLPERTWHQHSPNEYVGQPHYRERVTNVRQ